MQRHRVTGSKTDMGTQTLLKVLREVWGQVQAGLRWGEVSSQRAPGHLAVLCYLVPDTVAIRADDRRKSEEPHREVGSGCKPRVGWFAYEMNTVWDVLPLRMLRQLKL